MHILETTLPGVLLLEPKVIGDERGFFMESYRRDLFEARGLNIDFVQDNHAKSGPAHVLRGMHFQLPPMAQCKLVRVTAGAVWDVVVDLRKGSPAFGKWEGFELSARNFRQLLVPRGFAHGYVTLTSGSEFVYKVDAYYSRELDTGLAWDDPDLAIQWPVKEPVLSDKDKSLPGFKNFDSPFTYQP